MKTKSTFILGFAMLAGLTFYSCDDEESITPLSDELYPVKITEYEDGEGYSTNFEYDENKRIIKLDDGDGYYSKYEYDAEGKLIKEEDYEENVLYMYGTFIYNDNDKVIKREIYWADGAESGYDTFEYNTEGLLIKESSYDSSDELDSYYVYEEYDANGNIIKAKFFDENYGENMTDYYDQITYQYDTKKNSFIMCGEYAYFIYAELGLNNLTKEISVQHYGDNETEIYTHNYAYNESGYPTECTTSADGEEDYRFTTKYKKL